MPRHTSEQGLDSVRQRERRGSAPTSYPRRRAACSPAVSLPSGDAVAAPTSVHLAFQLPPGNGSLSAPSLRRTEDS